MYQWLLAVLRALRDAARQAPAPAPALALSPDPRPEPPPRKKAPPSVLSPVEDPEDIPAKRLKPECVSGANKEPEEVSVAARLPPKATSRSQETEKRDDFSFSEPEDEVVYISSDSSFVASAEDEDTAEPGRADSKMPCDTNPCLTEETPSSLCKRVPYLSLSRNNHIRAAPESPVTPRPPIKEPGPNSPGVSGTRRPLCAAEEDVQQAENKKYKELLSLFKEKYSGRLTSPRSARLNKVRTKEPGMTGSPLKEQKPRGASPPVPERTSVKHGDVFSPQLPQRGVMISYYTPPEDSRGQGKREKRAASVGQCEAEVPQRKLFQFHVTPVLSKDLFFVDSEPLPCLEKPGDDLAPLTEAMESEISAAFDSGEPEDILSRAFKLTVTREDICTLQPLGWLNDRIMNFYMGLLVERSKKEGYPAVYAFNTFFYSKLSSTSHKGVKKWTKGVDIFEHDVILVPIHLRIHWTLLVVDLREKTIKYFDSLGQKGDHICKTVLKYLEEESREKRNIELTASEWTLHSMGTEVWEQCLDLEWELELLVTEDLTLPRKSLNKIMEMTVEFLFANLPISSPETNPSSSPRNTCLISAGRWCGK
ncbi:sentrin-specific protease 2 isoform X1 [Haemorhous mexicanus]|uniref:sentrin-specific protease 2 isoform X1 n=1 Tax=Haemorhous mexicanus TaxID=30427 RepID=UPI0028BDED2E|nr:sentrin-specific protease 2 isoform X1 [Haemorhous mexicanus]